MEKAKKTALYTSIVVLLILIILSIVAETCFETDTFSKIVLSASFNLILFPNIYFYHKYKIDVIYLFSLNLSSVVLYTIASFLIMYYL